VRVGVLGRARGLLLTGTVTAAGFGRELAEALAP